MREQAYRPVRFPPPHVPAGQADALAVDCATYSGPVEVRESLPGRGRGLFTTRKVTAGELLCEKAFEYASAGANAQGGGPNRRAHEYHGEDGRGRRAG